MIKVQVEYMHFDKKNFLIKSIFLFESNLSSTQKGRSTQKVVQIPKFLEGEGELWDSSSSVESHSSPLQQKNCASYPRRGP